MRKYILYIEDEIDTILISFYLFPRHWFNEYYLLLLFTFNKWYLKKSKFELGRRRVQKAMHK